MKLVAFHGLRQCMSVVRIRITEEPATSICTDSGPLIPLKANKPRPGQKMLTQPLSRPTRHP